jgi:hypothetical protein
VGANRFACEYVYLFVCMYVSMCVCVVCMNYKCMYVYEMRGLISGCELHCMSVCMYVYLCIYVSMCVCVVCMYVFMYVCV